MKNYLFKNGVNPNNVYKQSDGTLTNYPEGGPFLPWKPLRTFIETEDGRFFYLASLSNNRIAPCYELVKTKTGKTYNVNLNTGEAYRSNLTK